MNDPTNFELTPLDVVMMDEYVQNLDAERQFIERRKQDAQTLQDARDKYRKEQDAWEKKEFAEAKRSLRMWGWAFLITFIATAIAVAFLAIKIGERFS